MPYFQGEPGLLHGEVRQGHPGVQGGVPHLQLVGELSLEGSATWNWQQEKTVNIESDSEQKTSQDHHRPSQGDDDDCDDGDDDDDDNVTIFVVMIIMTMMMMILMVMIIMMMMIATSQDHHGPSQGHT